MSLSYFTPDGQAVTHAMQPRHLSKCPRTASVSSIFFSSKDFMRYMRPRGESISSFQLLYVGQAGRQNPQCTHSSISFLSGNYKPPTKRPGFRRRSGSKLRLSRSMSGKDGGTGPHGSNPGGRPACTTREPETSRRAARAAVSSAGEAVPAANPSPSDG